MAVVSVSLALGTFSLAQSGSHSSGYGADYPSNNNSDYASNYPQNNGSNSGSNYAGDNSSNYPADAPTPVLSQNELENLVAPVALYPDALLSQVLVASTYPLEVIEARDWLRQNGGLPSRQLMAAAQQENWDPSVQALVAFPGVVERMSRDVRWTTDLGNAFLVQQADVMNAIQNLRGEARENGQLRNTPQLAVNTEVQGEQNAIEIQPTDPGRMYVPNYDPYAVWGAPAQGDYPQLNYSQGNGFDSVLGAVANLAGFFPGFAGVLGPRSWGWAIGWLAQTLFVNNSFFSDFGFHNSGGGYGGGGYGGSSVWVHNEQHRLGVPYGNGSGRGGRDNWGRDNGGRGRDGDGRGQNRDQWGRNRDGFRDFNGRGGEPRRASYRSDDFGSRRGDFDRDNRNNRGENWRSFDGRENGNPQGQSNLRRWRGPGTNPNSVRASGMMQPTRTASRAWSQPSRVSTTRTSPERGFAGSYSGTTNGASRGAYSQRSYPRQSSGKSSSGQSFLRRGSAHEYSSRASSSSHGSSSHHSMFSHSSAPRAPKAPKMKAPHYAKSGGHSGGHGKKSHRG
jgi:Protein of unknown function (DUF3300)